VEFQRMSISRAEYFLKVSRIKLFRLTPLPAGGIFMPL